VGLFSRIKNALAPSEGSQHSKSNTAQGADGRVSVFHCQGKLESLSENGVYPVMHAYSKAGAGHHSHILIMTLDCQDVLFNFGLFGDQDGGAWIRMHPGVDERWAKETSGTYEPNPIAATKPQILAAFDAATAACGGKYKLLHNNCQKFAREFFTALGATHNREMFRL